MKTIEKFFLALGAILASSTAANAADVSIRTPYNPATGIWIQQVGDLYPSASTFETVYYTRYSEQLSAKAVDYYYDGNGYLKLYNRRLLCRTRGADGIIHHPDGDLVVAGQNNNEIYKVSKSAKDTLTNQCVTKTVSSQVGSSTFHLMMNPDNTVLWSAGIPGNLVSFATDSTGKMDRIRQVKVYGDVNNITTIVWDKSQQAYYTRSDNMGEGSYAQFGKIVDTTCAINAKPCPANQITGLKTKTLISGLNGAHGASFDDYSETILLFGGTHIVQIDPSNPSKIAADVDLNKYLFTPSNENHWVGYNRWLLDQGTADHKGHIFVASNSGHLIFVDFTSNPNKLIDNNILIHVQWIDNYLDDVAPMAGAGSNRQSANTEGGNVVSSNSHSSSASVYKESSSSKVKSSSSTGTSRSSSSRSSSSKSSSSSVKGGSSGSDNSSSSIGEGGNSSSGKTGSSSSVGEGGDKSSSSNGGDGGKSSNSGTGTGEDPSSSSKGGSGSEEEPQNSSSSNGGNGSEWVPPWSKDSTYSGFDDDGSEDKGGSDAYPTNDKRDKGDTLVTNGSILVPSSSQSSDTNHVVINGETYKNDSTQKSIPLPTYGADSSYATGRERVNVGDVIQITLDANKIKDYFSDSDSLFISGTEGLLFVDPKHPSSPNANISVGVGDEDVTIWVTADTTVSVGSIYFTDKDGHLIIFDGINFYDPIPAAEIGYIQDSDDDGFLDSIEVILADTIPKGMTATGLAILIDGDTLPVHNALSVSKNRIFASADGLQIKSDNFPEDAKVIITYTSEQTGANYRRKGNLLELGSHVINQAYAIRNLHGRDSLFIEFNVDIIPADLKNPEMVTWLNGQGFDLDEVNVYLPTKNTIILVGDSLKLNGKTDYVTLAPGAVFENLSFIASAEYDRQVPVKVVDRFPAMKTVEYYDTDGNGELDSIAVRFSTKVTAEELENYYFSFPWYSSRGLLINLQAQPKSLILSADGKSAGWRVTSNQNVASNLTSVSAELPPATLYTYYTIFGNSFVSSQTIPVTDKMAPVISAATLHYGESARRDTLTVSFSEAVDYESLVGKDFFAYIHSKDTIDLNPTMMLWAADGKSVQLILRESTDGIVPGDSLMIIAGKKSNISDVYGNASVKNASPVVIGGLLGKIVESVNMGFFDPEQYVTNTLNSVSISYVSNQTRTSDLRNEGTLGHLISLGERFVPQLIDGAKTDADGNYDAAVLDSIDPADVFVNFSVSYFDNLGQYVTDTTFNIPCNSAAFGTDQNCLTTDKKVFVNWNYKDHTGRLVGSGVYVVEFKLVVRYKQKKIQEEMRDKWGVRRKKSK
ncbi:hypothetical protein [Hallerella porci]|uniref:SbsA Ig-like domain-containing protein n=1 Tax=Hallerella porci TaxID=1945871 RepID=A0ABX5LMQ2_9BACT|nr:hypothetical protein [Hallerella porci]PWL03714.1 hypothetical protein B0H50_1036 [Hallerella porci]